MSNTKTNLLIKSYFEKNHSSIEQARLTKSFTWKAVCDEIGIPHNYSEHIRSRYRQFRQRRDENATLHHVVDLYHIPPTLIAELTSDGVQPQFIYNSGSENKDKGIKEFVFTADKIPTEDEIVEHFNIDLKKYRISQIWHKTTPSGRYSISVNLQALKGESAVDYKQLFKDFIDSYNTSIVKSDLNFLKEGISTNKNVENALIISLADLHLDVKSFASETGNDSDMYKSFDRALKAVKDILYRANYGHGIEEIIFIGGNDFYHANSAKNTTEKGTPLDVDGRFHESFKLGISLITTMLDMCKVYAPVRYYTCYGNHSPEREFYLAAALEAFYRNDDMITIETDPKSRKYFSFGNSAFMLSHDAPKSIKDLPVIFATENPSLFTMKYKFLLTGHLHSKQETFFIGTKENFGLVWKRMPSLAKSDKWHFDSFFIGNQKSCIGLVINKTHGEIAEYIYNE